MPSVGRISAIEPKGRKTGRVAIYVDGVEQLTIHRAALKSLGVKAGASVDVEELLASAEVAERRAGMDAALGLLAIRSRSAQELRERLGQKRFARDMAEAVVEHLRELGYVDDKRCAVEFVRARIARRPCGRRALQAELRRKGIEGELIDDVLDECLGDVDEVDLAVSVIERGLPRLANLDGRTARSRLGSLLQRRGFGYEVIREAVARALPETDMDEDVASSGE